MKKILVAGDIMLDTYVFGVVNRISPEAPVPVLLKDKTKKKTVPGGAANVAVNIKAANCDVDLLSMIGRDENATKLINLLNDISIGTASIIEDETSVTTTKLRYIGQNNQQILRVDSEEKLNISTDKKTLIAERLEQQLKEAEYSLILLSDYNKGFLSEDICQLIIREAVDSNIPVLVDVKGTNASKYNGATLLKPNRSELRDLTDMPVDTMEEVRQASQYLQKSTGCKYVLTTLGADGMYLYTEDGETKHIGTVAKEVYDVTGAGDTSIAYLAVCLAAGENIESAMEIANIAASVQVSKVGTSTVSWDEVELAKNAIGLQASKKQLNFYRENGLSIIDELKSSGKKIVFTNGCFDILHAGHIRYLSRAKELGDVLVVGVNSDASVRRLKGEERPINNIADRMLLLAALESVDYVVTFEEDTPYELIKQIVPDVLVKGGDYDISQIVGADIVAENGGITTTVPYVEGKSTTSIIEKMRSK